MVRPDGKRTWIGVDLDETLAHYDGWRNGPVGAPVPAMADRVRAWLSDGRDVRIFTARVCPDERGWNPVKAWREMRKQRRIIQAWTLEHFGVALPVTYRKGYLCEAIWDDRAVTVESNTGRCLTCPKSP